MDFAPVTVAIRKVMRLALYPVRQFVRRAPRLTDFGLDCLMESYSVLKMIVGVKLSGN